MKKHTAVIILAVTLASLCAAEPDADFRVAKSAFEDGLYQIASNQLLQFIKRYPEDEKIAEAYFYLGESLLNLESFEQAREAYARAAAHPPLAEAALYRTACAYYREGEEDKCAEAFRKYLDAHPEGEFSETAAFRLGECLMKAGETEEAAAAFLKLPAINPGSEHLHKALYSAGIARLRSRNFPGAEEAFELLLESEPDESIKPGVLYWLAHVRLKTGERGEAGILFAELAAEFPGSAFADSALYQAGITELKNGDFEKSAALLGSLLENYKNSPLAGRGKLELGLAMEKLGEKENAARLYSELADSGAEADIRAEALRRHGLLELSQGENERALELFSMLEELLQKEGKTAPAAFHKSAACSSMGEYEKALAAAGGADIDESLNGLKSALDFLEAGARFSLEDYGAAGNLFSRIAESGGPLAERAMFYSALCLYKAGEHEKSAEKLIGFTEHFPENALAHEAHLAAGEALFSLGDFKAAAEHYKKAAQRQDLENTAYLRKGRALNSAGMPGAAVSAYGKAGGEHREAAKVKIAETLYLAGDFTGAAEKAAAAGTANTQAARHAKYILAAAYFRMDELDKAETKLTEFMEQFPDSRYMPAVLFNLGAVRYRIKDYEDAYGFFEKIATSFPGEPEALKAEFLSGMCLVKSGRTEEALEKLEGYIKKAGEAAGEEAALTLGGLYYEKGRMEEARAMLSPLTESGEEKISVKACFELGRVLEAEQDHAAAREMFGLVMERSDDREEILEAMLRTAAIFREEKEYGKALEAYRRISAEYPEHEIRQEADYYAARMLQNLERYPEALRAYSAIEPPRPEEMEADISLRKSDCLYEIGNYKEALLGYLKTAYLYPARERSALTALESAAELLKILGRVEESVKIYKKIIELDPGGIKGEMASQKLMEIKQ